MQQSWRGQHVLIVLKFCFFVIEWGRRRPGKGSIRKEGGDSPIPIKGGRGRPGSVPFGGGRWPCHIPFKWGRGRPRHVPVEGGRRRPGSVPFGGGIRPRPIPGEAAREWPESTSHWGRRGMGKSSLGRGNFFCTDCIVSYTVFPEEHSPIPFSEAKFLLPTATKAKEGRQTHGNGSHYNWWARLLFNFSEKGWFS